MNLKAKLRSYTQALNRYDLDAVEAMFAKDAIYVSAGVGGKIIGRDMIMATFRSYFAIHTKQRNWDSDICVISERVIQSSWRLEAAGSSRSGTQRVFFDNAGLIERVEVQDV